MTNLINNQEQLQIENAKQQIITQLTLVQPLTRPQLDSILTPLVSSYWMAGQVIKQLVKENKIKITKPHPFKVRTWKFSLKNYQLK